MSGFTNCAVRARPHRESCLFGDDVVDTTHLVCWLLRPLLVSVNISVLCVVCFQSMEAIVHRVCLRDNSAETTRRFAMAAIGSFHVEVVMS